MNRHITTCMSIIVILAAAGRSLGQASSGGPDPGRTGGCDPSSMPTSPGQNRPTDSHDNDGLGPCDIPIVACGDDFPAGLAPWGSYPDGIVETDPPPQPAPGPPVICGYADSSPSCAGTARGTAQQLWGSSPPYQGYGWFQASRPELIVSPSGSAPDRLRIVLNARKVIDFSLVASSSPNVFVGVNGAQGVVVRVDGSSTAPELYRYYDAKGNVWTFFGYYTGSSGTWLNPYGAKGQLWTCVNADGGSAGAVFYTGDATTASTALSTGFVQDSSSHPTALASTVYDGAGRKWVYTYESTIGSTSMLTSIDIYTDTDPTSGFTWTLAWSVDYAYYESDSSNKSLAGDLKTVTETRPLSSGGDDVRTTYFRYYTDTSPNDFTHLIKCRVDPEGVRRAGGASALDALGTSGTDLTTLKSYASLYYTYDNAGRVSQVEMGAACGCGGSSDGIYTLSRDTNASYDSSLAYGSSGTNGTGDWGYQRWKNRTIATKPNGSKEVLYFDEMGWLLARVITDAANSTSPFDPSSSLSPPNKIWITKYERDGLGRPVKEYTPAAVDSSSYAHSTGSITVRSDAGLVRVTDYYAPTSGPNYLGLAATKRKVQVGSGGGSSAITTQEYSYVDPTGSTPSAARDFGTTNPARLAKPLLAWRKAYRDPSTVDETTYSYTFYSSTWEPKTITETLPSLDSGDNSGPSTVTTASYLDERGQTVFSSDGVGTYSFNMYGIDGQVAKSIEDPANTDSNANSAASTFSLSLGTGNLHYVTQYSYDLEGRLASITLPSGRSRTSHYTKLSDGRLVSLEVPKYASSTYTGPVSYQVRNLADKVEAEGVIALPDSGGTTTTAISSWISTSSSDVIGAVQIGSVKQLTVKLYDARGTRLEASRLFNTIPSSYSGATSGQYEETTFGYDDSGRLRRVVDPTGTITYTKRDARERAYERWAGTNDHDSSNFPGGATSGTSNMVKVQSMTFDGGGVGNGLITSQTTFVDSTSGHDRTTSTTYDFRNRPVVSNGPEKPYLVMKYDDQNRVTAVGNFTSSPGLVDPTSATTNRVALIETIYNSRGQVRESKRHEIEQGGSTPGVSEDTLSQLSWYDGAGRVVKFRGESLTKTSYDAMGRPTHWYELAKDADGSSYSDVITVSGDEVEEERQSLYDDSGKTGNVLMTVVISRHPHDASTTGALDAASDSSVDVVAVGDSAFYGRPQITSYYYSDPLDRLTAVVRLGNNGGSTYTRSSDSTAGTRSAARLVTSTVYSPDGTVLSTTDPNGIESRTEYDAAGRTTKTIVNYVDGAPGGGTNGDQDQVVQYTYTSGQLTTMIAKMPSSSDDQTTTYTYGVVTTGTLPSAIASNRLLRQVQYPDSSAGSDAVTYAYNRVGQHTNSIDQAGNQIDNAFDGMGRLLSRSVSTLASGFDGSVRRIEIGYLDRGPISTVKQFNAASGGDVTDVVRYDYDDWGNIGHFRQDVDSDIDSSGASSAGRGAFDVQYVYTKSAPTGGTNTVRRTNTYLRSGGTTFEQINYGYGTSGGINDSMSRVASLSTGSSSPVTVASYDYLGADQVVGTTLDEPALNTSVFTESSGVHSYSDLDNFNRTIRWNWERIGGASGGFYNTEIAYDQDGNPAQTVDDVPLHQSSTYHLFDVVYTLDNLNRVIGADEGARDGTSGLIQSGHRTRKELWNSLSLSGNWGNRQLDANGDGDYTDANDRDEPSANNTFNKANEWTARRIQKSGTDHDDYSYSYDATGNLTGETLEQVRSGSFSTLSGRTFVYDAFGRLTKMSQGAVFVDDDSGPVYIAQYRYNGLGFRIMVQEDVDGNGSLSDSERYYIAFNDKWQQVATFRNQDSNPKEAFVYHEAGSGGYGDSSYPDSAVLRDKDTANGWTGTPAGVFDERRYYCHNWRSDVVAICAANGDPLEITRYSAYGESNVYPVGDYNCDGIVNSSDYSAFFAAVAGTGNADVDFDGTPGSEHDIDLFYDSYTANSGVSGIGRVSSPAVANQRGLTGHTWDQVLAMYLMRSRLYDPATGRFLTRDPIGYDVASSSLYEYVRSNPVEFLDPFGLQRRIDEPGPDPRPKTPVPITAPPGTRAPYPIYPGDDPDDIERRQRPFLNSPPGPTTGNPDTTKEFWKGANDGWWCWCEGVLDMGASTVSFGFWDPECHWFDGLMYDPTDPNLKVSRTMGKVSCVCMTAYAGAKGAKLRIEKGEFKFPKKTGEQKIRWHFHIGPEELQKWHLPYEWYPWWKNTQGILKRKFKDLFPWIMNDAVESAQEWL